MRWSEATQLYLEAKAVDGYSSTTLKGYQLQFALFQRWLGEDLDLDAITTTQLRTYFAKDVGTRKPTTIGHRIRAIHSLWHWCVEEEITDRDPSRRIKEPKAGDRIPKALSVDQLEDLREACQTPRDHALLELFFATGARLAELCQLNRADIQCPFGTITPPVTPLASGTVYQNMSGVAITIYQPAYATTSGTAGSVAAALGSTDTPSTLYTDLIDGSTTSSIPRTLTLRVPPGWYYAFTTSGATLANAQIQGE